MFQNMPPFACQKGRGMPRQLLSSVCLFLLFLAVRCDEEEPITCSSADNKNCTITNTYGAFCDRSVCRVAAAAYPTTEEELIAIVADATRSGLKMKAATRFGHSIPPVFCPGSEDGLLISTKFLNRVLSIDTEAGTVTVESGVSLRELINASAAAGLALPYSPYWWGLTVGGMLATGSHGSTLSATGSAVHDYVVGLTIVSPGESSDGFVKVRRLVEGDEEIKAAKVSIGVLGVISQVTFKLQRLFKRSITFESRSDSDLADRVLSFGRQHEFADVTWYPSRQEAVYRVDERVPDSIPGNGLYDTIAFRPTSSYELAIVRVSEELFDSIPSAKGKCIIGNVTVSSLSPSAYGLTNDGTTFSGYPVVGYQNRIQASGTCLDSTSTDLVCPWDRRVNGFFFHQTAVSVGLSVVKGFIEDVQKLVKLEPEALCGLNLYNGILLRYTTASNAYLGKQEDAVYFDITYYRSKDPLTPRLYEDILEEIEQIAVFKYGGLPHWGKNRNVAFIGAINKYKNSKEFLRIKEVYDPKGLFSSDWSDKILGLKDGLTIMKEGCALEGLCICSEDIHCAPSKGYFCREGKIYKEARVCTRLGNDNNTSTIDTIESVLGPSKEAIPVNIA